MKYHDHHFSWLGTRDGETILLVGMAGGRVYCGEYREHMPDKHFWLHSLRFFLLFCKFEINWTTP